jgi:hypothetical protein
LRLEETAIVDRCVDDVTVAAPWAEIVDVDAVPFVVGIAAKGVRRVSVIYTIGGVGEPGPSSDEVEVVEAGHVSGGTSSRQCLRACNW